MFLSEKKQTNLDNHKTYKFSLSGGFNSGIEASNFIIKISNAFKKSPSIRNLAVKIVNSAPSHDFLKEVELLFNWVRDNIRYIRDIKGVETLQIPTVTLPDYYSKIGIGAGDCDDHVILLLSFLLSIGISDLNIRIVAYKPEDREFRHIYLCWLYKGKEYIMDSIAKNKAFGWEVNYYSKKDIKVK